RRWLRAREDPKNMIETPNQLLPMSPAVHRHGPPEGGHYKRVRSRRRDRGDGVGERTVQLVVDAVQVPVDQLRAEGVVLRWIVAGQRHHQIVEPWENRRFRLVRIEAARLRRLALAQQHT